MCVRVIGLLDRELQCTLCDVAVPWNMSFDMWFESASDRWLLFSLFDRLLQCAQTGDRVLIWRDRLFDGVCGRLFGS